MGLLAIAYCLLPLSPQESWAVGTSSQTTITNGTFNSGDTVPQAAGGLSISYRTSPSTYDSKYAGFNSAGVSITVDTAYDLDTLSAPANKTGVAGETVSYAYVIKNLGNATITVYLDSVFHPAGQSDSGPSSVSSSNWNISGSYKTYYDLNNDGVWADGDTQITSVVLAAGAADTVIVVVIIPPTANDGETTTTALQVTNRAPRNSSTSTTGDGWQDSAPIAGNDVRDTQYDTTVTRVSAPNVIVTKTVTEVTTGNSRPGDTLQFVISFDNDGTDSARGLTILDAVPLNTRYVWNSADTNQGGGDTTALSFTLSYDSDPVGSTPAFNDTNIPASSGSNVTHLRWILTNPLGEDNGDNNGAVNYDGVYDNGRVRFRVWIQ